MARQWHRRPLTKADGEYILWHIRFYLLSQLTATGAGGPDGYSEAFITIGELLSDIIEEGIC